MLHHRIRCMYVFLQEINVGNFVTLIDIDVRLITCISGNKVEFLKYIYHLVRIRDREDYDISTSKRVLGTR